MELYSEPDTKTHAGIAAYAIRTGVIIQHFSRDMDEYAPDRWGRRELPGCFVPDRCLATGRRSRLRRMVRPT